MAEQFIREVRTAIKGTEKFNIKLFIVVDDWDETIADMRKICKDEGIKPKLHTEMFFDERSDSFDEAIVLEVGEDLGQPLLEHLRGIGVDEWTDTFVPEIVGRVIESEVEDMAAKAAAKEDDKENSGSPIVDMSSLPKSLQQAIQNGGVKKIIGVTPGNQPNVVLGK